jgi:hypothetical protein
MPGKETGAIEVKLSQVGQQGTEAVKHRERDFVSKL